MSHDDSDPSQPNRSRRERSTKYPGVALPECIELARFIATKGLDGLPATDIAQAQGYKNIKTNTFSAPLSGARQFGLLALENEGYHLTPLAKAILHPVDPIELPKLYRQALLEPPIYAEIVGKLADKVVPEATILGNILYHNHQIIATAKEAAASAFIASAKFAGALGEEGILRLNPPQIAAAPAPVAKPEKPASRSKSPVKIDLPLWGEDSGKTIRVRAPESITPASFERLVQTLRLHIRIEEPPSSRS